MNNALRTNNRCGKMKFLKNLSIKNKLILNVLAVSFLVAGLGFGIVILHQIKHLHRDLKENSILQAQIISEYCISPLLFEDFEGIDEILDKIKVNPVVQTVAVYNNDGAIVASYLRDTTVQICPSLMDKNFVVREKNSLHVHQPIIYEGQAIGAIGLHVSTRNVKAEINAFVVTICLFMIGLMVLAYFLADVLQKHISKPILKLASISDYITRSQDFTVDISRETEDEIGKLYRSFKAMIKQIQIQQYDLEQSIQNEKKGLFHQKVINRATVQLGNITDLFEIYEHVYRSVASVMDTAVFLVSSYNPETKLISAAYIKCDDKSVDVTNLPPIPLEKEGVGTQSRVIYSGEPIYTSNVDEQLKDTETRYVIGEEGEVIAGDFPEEKRNVATNSAIYVPLKYEQQVVGVMQVQSYNPEAYTQKHVDLLFSLANVTSMALQNARLFNEMEIKIRSRTAQLNEHVEEKEQLNRAMTNVLEDQKASNITLAKTTRLLEASNKELEAFAYSISHDLRAPLRAIDGFAQMLAEDHMELLDENGKHQIAVIQKSARDMGKLIDGLLRFSRLGRKGLRFTNINMTALADEVTKMLLGKQSDDPRIDIKINELPHAFGDIVLIKEVFQNLIANAIKFSSQQDVAKIEIGLKLGNGEPAYYIKDNGAGFDMRYADKLFGVFQRLHDRESFEGTGIGLALVQRIIHIHGGRIWAEAEVDKGATFFFIIPNKAEVGND